MAKLPRLNDLIRLANFAADDAHRILYADPAYLTILKAVWLHQVAHELQRLRLLLPLVLEPASAADGKVRAWRVSNHQIPMLICGQDLPHITLVMEWRIIIRWQQITAPRIVPTATKGPAH